MAQKWSVAYDTRIIPKRSHPACPVAYKSGLPCSGTCEPLFDGTGFQMACTAHMSAVTAASDQDLYRKFTPKCPYCVGVGSAKPDWCARMKNTDRVVHPSCYQHAVNIPGSAPIAN